MPRNVAWKRARRNKEGGYHPEVKSIVETIVSGEKLDNLSLYIHQMILNILIFMVDGSCRRNLKKKKRKGH